MPRDLESLPPETLSHIVSYLLPYQLESLARTFNKKLTYICVPYLQKHNASIRNARRMIARFGEQEPLDSYGMFKKAYAAAGLEAEWGPFHIPAISSDRFFTIFDHLELDGTGRWLHGSAPDSLVSKFPYDPNEPLGSIMHDEVISNMEKKLKVEGVPLPICLKEAEDEGVPFSVCLVRYLTERTFHECISMAACHRGRPGVGRLERLYGQVGECVPLDGYVLSMNADINLYEETYIYFQKYGGECVLSSDDILEACHPSYLREIVSGRRARIWLRAISFEEFLARFFLESLAEEYTFRVSKDNAADQKLPPMVEEFLIKTFSEKGRAGA